MTVNHMTHEKLGFVSQKPQTGMQIGNHGVAYARPKRRTEAGSARANIEFYAKFNVCRTVPRSA
jgi:hypothetical protein